MSAGSEVRPKVITIIGATGIGKTYAVYENNPCVYAPNYGKYGVKRVGIWEEFQTTLLLDNFSGQLPLAELVRIMEGGGVYVNTRTGGRRVYFRTVIIAGCSFPHHWYRARGTPKRMTELDSFYRLLGVGTPNFIAASTRAELNARLTLAGPL